MEAGAVLSHLFVPLTFYLLMHESKTLETAICKRLLKIFFLFGSFFQPFCIRFSKSWKMKIYFVPVDSTLHTLAQFNLQCTLAKLSLIGSSVALLPSPGTGQNLIF